MKFKPNTTERCYFYAVVQYDYCDFSNKWTVDGYDVCPQLMQSNEADCSVAKQ